MTEYLQVVTTTETREQALTIAGAAVRSRGAACAQVMGPVTSLFWWEGRMEETEEYLVVMKTHAGAYQALEETIRANHTYDVPEILGLPVLAGGADYLAWIRDQVGMQPPENPNKTA